MKVDSILRFMCVYDGMHCSVRKTWCDDDDADDDYGDDGVIIVLMIVVIHFI